jgi:cell wall-associated NlpC family hydrolase
MMRSLLARAAYGLLAVTVLIGCQQATSTPGASADTSVQVNPPDSTQDRFKALMDVAREQALHEQPLGVIMTTMGQEVMGAPYLAGTLDEPRTEQLVIRFDGFDCVTFVETMLALARGVEQQQYDYASFARRIEEQRYREGELEGYCSRMHYFTEWIAQNDERGTVRSITQRLGGVPLTDSLSFMSTHREAYPRFATNDSLLACVRSMEADLSGTTIYHVPQDRIRSVYDQLQSGDIIGFSTDIGGLDVAHTGLVLKDSGQAKLLHASLSDGVVVSPDLQRYVQNIDHQVGIVVARPLSSRGS